VGPVRLPQDARGGVPSPPTPSDGTTLRIFGVFMSIALLRARRKGNARRRISATESEGDRIARPVLPGASSPASVGPAAVPAGSNIFP
jgi:hypothetical protein